MVKSVLKLETVPFATVARGMEAPVVELIVTKNESVVLNIIGDAAAKMLRRRYGEPSNWIAPIPTIEEPATCEAIAIKTIQRPPSIAATEKSSK